MTPATWWQQCPSALNANTPGVEVCSSDEGSGRRRGRETGGEETWEARKVEEEELGAEGGEKEREDCNLQVEKQSARRLKGHLESRKCPPHSE